MIFRLRWVVGCSVVAVDASSRVSNAEDGAKQFTQIRDTLYQIQVEIF